MSISSIPDCDQKREIVLEWMDLIDAALSHRSVDISARLMPSCVWFVEYAVEGFGNTEGGFISNPEIRRQFLLSKSFQEFFVIILEWYKDKYGQAFSARKEWTLIAAVMYSGTALKMCVPVLYKRSAERDVLELKFSTSVEKDESVKDWVQNPPNWDRISDQQKLSLISEATWIASSLRKVKAELLNPDCPDKDSKMLRTDVPLHLEAAASHILDGRSYGLSSWEAHQSCEKILKFVLRQSKAPYPHTHELEKLWSLLPSDRKSQISPFDFQKLPTAKQAVDLRYGGNSAIIRANSYEYYKNSIEFVLNCTNAVESKHRLAGRVTKFRKPEFMP